MYLVIAGGGDVGRALVRRAINRYRRVKITVIERDFKTCEELANDFPVVNVVQGDMTNISTLERAKVSRADVYAAVTTHNSDNIVSALLAKRMGAKVVVARVEGGEEYAELALKLGIDHVVTPAESAAAQIDLIIRNPHLMSLLELVSERTVIECVEVGEGGDPPPGAVVPDDLLARDLYPILVLRGDEFLIPLRRLELRNGDRVLVIRRRPASLLPSLPP